VSEELGDVLGRGLGLEHVECERQAGEHLEDDCKLEREDAKRDGTSVRSAIQTWFA
jgi:hypothetical protein